MAKPDHFEIEGDLAVFRPVGSFSLPEAVRLITLAISSAQEQGAGKLLVVALEATGFDPPSLASRYFFSQEWARAARGSVRLAMVLRREMIDPQKFGVTAAANAGLVSDVFETEAEARVWLKDGRVKTEDWKAPDKRRKTEGHRPG